MQSPLYTLLSRDFSRDLPSKMYPSAKGMPAGLPSRSPRRRPAVVLLLFAAILTSFSYMVGGQSISPGHSQMVLTAC